jgi:Spy/CpxP family protein refolding chaperone
MCAGTEVLRPTARRVVAALAAAAAALLGAPLNAAPPVGSVPFGGGPHTAGPGTGHEAPWSSLGSELWQDLNLTPEQRETVRGVIRAHQPRWHALREQASVIRETLTETSPDDPGYAAVTQEASQSAATLAAEMVTLANQMRAEIHAVLTPEQRLQIRQRLEQRRQRWEAWRQRSRPAP